MSREFLYELLSTASVSGFEEDIQRKVMKYAEGFADEIYTDEIADVVSVINPASKIKVMLSAHMDEIGLMVSHLTEKGMLHVSKAGGIYPGTYPGQKVRVIHNGKVVSGAVRNHSSLNKKEPEITDLIIDIGAVSREDAMEAAAPGDPVIFDTDYRELLNDRLCARGLDNRLGGYIILEAARKAKEKGCTCGVYAAATVGEELTKHGASWCASRIAPTLAVAVDVTYTSDYEGTRAIENGEIGLGGGPVFLQNSFSHKMLVGRLKKAAENLDISCQWENGCGRTCTDADAIHVAGRGIPTTVLSIPLRYMHNPAEVCSMSDVQACIDVLAEFLCSIGPDICLKPLEA